MSVLTGWHRFLVFCNDSLIASFPTEAMRASFLAERRRKYRLSEYTTSDTGR